eukprot:4146704-Pleurochrysis_carterae.AAC.1
MEKRESCNREAVGHHVHLQRHVWREPTASRHVITIPDEHVDDLFAQPSARRRAILADLGVEAAPHLLQL